jgi:thioredoxin 1
VDHDYDKSEPARSEVDGWAGPSVLEFGAAWCPHCQAAQPAIASVLDAHPEVRHMKIGDGKGKPLGRSFHVKLWPTLVFLRDGQEIARVVRPTSAAEIEPALATVIS